MAEVAVPTRARVEARLDRLVGDNRFTIAVVFPAVGAVLLLASAEGLLPASLSFNPYLVLFGTLVMRLPLVAGLAPLVDRRAALGLGFLTAYAYGIEYLGASTGVPYGDFSYLVELGPMLAGTVPLGLPAFFFPLVLNAYLSCLLVLGDRAVAATARLPTVVAVVLLMDLVLDPGAVALGFWGYEAGGSYYGVPWTNYAGWMLSATVAVGAVDLAFDHEGLGARLSTCEFVLDDLVSFVVLWGVVNAFYAQWIPALLAVALGAALWWTERFDLPRR